MDALDLLLRGPRAHGAFLLQSSLDPPWSLRIEDEAPLTIAAVVRGEAWVVFDDDAGTARLAAGDVMLCRGPIAYSVCDDPATPPQVIIGPDQVCRTVDGSSTYRRFEGSERTWGNAALGHTLLVTGTYERASHVSQRLLAALPPLSVLRGDEWDNPVLDMLVTEIVRDAPGQTALLDRTLDLLCLTTVRACLARPGATPPRWYTASADPIVGAALDLMHKRPAHPWTVARLAAAVGASRAAFARRFNELVGDPPLTYLTRWRLDIAADLLAAREMTVAQIAGAVGYENPFAFTNAFKRHTGSTPTGFRNRQAGQLRTAGSSDGRGYSDQTTFASGSGR